MRSGVARIGAYGHFEGSPGLVELALAGIEHGQVVVRLWQLGVVFREALEGCHRVGGTASADLPLSVSTTPLRNRICGSPGLVVRY